MKSIIVALQSQLTLTLGFTLCLIVSYFYLFINDDRFPEEKPSIIWAGFGISFVAFLIGTFLSRKFPKESPLNLREGAIAVILTWALATFISATVFVLAGIPDPARSDFSLSRQYIDGVFETISGFTTTGGSVLPSVEVFPRSILMWRSTTIFIGGMGIAYIAITIWKRFRFRRETIINSEAEGPNYTDFEKEKDAVEAGKDFAKIYLLLTAILFGLLVFSGIFFRESPYKQWYDNAFDSLNYTFTVMGTGGFGTYDASAGLLITEGDHQVIGGLRNPISEWIMAIFMFITGSNLGLWFILFYKRRLKDILTSTEFRVYTGFVALVTIGIWATLMRNGVYDSALDALRYSFFNVTTIISTTGLATSDFTVWPAAAEGLLFSCYLVGGMVGSTAGGLKVIRFIVLYKYVMLKVKNLIYGRHKSKFSFDGVTYDESSSGLILANIVLYFGLFMAGAILIMMTSATSIFPDGSTKTVDFTSAITASIANLGNIGPAVEIGNINAGPTGNYFAYSEIAKLIMSILMLVGRIGVITFLTLFITRRGLEVVKDSFEEQHFDSDEPIFHS